MIAFNEVVKLIDNTLTSVTYRLTKEHQIYTVECQGVDSLNILTNYIRNKPSNWKIISDVIISDMQKNTSIVKFTYKIYLTTQSKITMVFDKFINKNINKPCKEISSFQNKDKENSFASKEFSGQWINLKSNEKKQMNTEIQEIAIIGNYEFTNPNTNIQTAEAALLDFAAELKIIQDKRDDVQSTLKDMPEILANKYATEINKIEVAMAAIIEITELNETD